MKKARICPHTKTCPSAQVPHCCFHARRHRCDQIGSSNLCQHYLPFACVPYKRRKKKP
jgi:hypothetical protein